MIAKAGRLAVALHAVSTSSAMPAWPEYVRRVEKMRPELDRTNPRGAALLASMRVVAGAAPPTMSCAAAELLVALTSFVDDHGLAPPTAPFAVPRALRVLDAIEVRAATTAPDQLALALEVGEPNLGEAVLALHTATRTLARGRDTRLHPRLAMTLDERLARGRAIAPFHPDDARGGDPLGDTYHFWANVAAGLFASGGRWTELRRHVVGGALLAGPVLMRRVREGVFGNRLFYGDHARVDRLGLRVGYALGARASRRHASGSAWHGASNARWADA